MKNGANRHRFQFFSKIGMTSPNKLTLVTLPTFFHISLMDYTFYKYGSTVSTIYV